MHLLILTPQLPWPPHQGTTLRNYNLIRHLSQRHPITLFSLLAPGDDPEAGPLHSQVKHLITAPQPSRNRGDRLRDLFLSPLPDMALRLWHPAAGARLHAAVAEHPPELIQVEGIEMAPYLLALAAGGLELPYTLYDAHNAETRLQARALRADLRRPRRWPAAAYSAVQVAKLARYERRLLRAVDGVAAVSEADAEALRGLAPGCIPAVIPNGVDLDDYDPAAIYPDPYPAGQRPIILFTGKMDFRPNVDGALWFAQKVLPRLATDGLEPHFWIVGKNPHTRLDVLRGRPGVTLSGAVPAIQPYIAHADLCVVPLLAGGGTRLKIMEAMAMAKPIVSTAPGADGFPVDDGEQLALTAAEPAAFARRCQELLRDPQAAAAMGQRGRAFVEGSYEWRRIVPRLEHLYLQIKRWSAKSLP